MYRESGSRGFALLEPYRYSLHHSQIGGVLEYFGQKKTIHASSVFEPRDPLGSSDPDHPRMKLLT